MSDHERRSPLRDPLELGLDRFFRARVERRGGFVEDQDARILEQRARNRHALLLAAGELEAALADHGRVLRRQRLDEVVDVRGARGFDDFGIARLRPPVADVVENAVVEKHRVLRHDADRRAQARLFHLSHILAVDEDRTGRDIIKAVEQPRERRLARARVSHHGDAVAGGNREAHAMQDLALALIKKVRVPEFHRRRPAREFRRTRAIFDLAMLGEEAEHAVHVEQRLLDLAVHHAEEVERDVELDQQAVDQHQVAQSEALCGNAFGHQQHQRRHRNGDDEALADVEQAQGRFVLHRRRFIALQVLVVAPRLEFLVAEVLHRFVIQQAVDGARVGLRVELVGAPADVHAPLGDQHGERDVDRHGAEGDRGKAPVELAEQHRRDQREFEDHRQDREQQVRKQRRDAARAALDVARHPAGLALEVKAQRQAVQVPEHAERHAPDGALRDAHEHHVAQLGEQRGREAQAAVDGEQRDRHRDDRGPRVEPVHDLLHNEGHRHVRQLGGDQAGERRRYPPLVFQQIGQQDAQRAPFIAFQPLDRRRAVSAGGHWRI